MGTIAARKGSADSDCRRVTALALNDRYGQEVYRETSHGHEVVLRIEQIGRPWENPAARVADESILRHLFSDEAIQASFVDGSGHRRVES
jgi:hypothetical protein